MKKMLLLGVFAFYVMPAFAGVDAWADAYQSFKTDLQNKTGLSYSLDVSFLPQRGAPSGKVTAWQTQYYGSASWNMFSSDTFGSGVLQAAYTAVRYWGNNANVLGNNIGVISSVNDYPSNVNNFDELSYTHTLPGKLKSISVTLGQFPMYNFDGTDYNSNQQINFINFALSQNASSVYPTASLGGYITWAPNNTWSFTVGGQNANNVSGETISWDDFQKGKWTSFVSASWNPTIMGLAGEYSITLYDQPSVSAQPVHSQGWSFNAQQFINKKMALFARANGTNKSLSSIKQSYVIGAVYNNPLNRNSLDQIGLAAAMNKLNRSVNGAGTRSWENVLEGYISVGVSNFMTITPDVQFYINPGANEKSNTATVVSLRATLMF
ncbi:MAG: carbohydrate porin [Alphaproteobacteria bacterium]|nr:carbohydrate porin [Alphaproteobacteria bacterium]